MIKLLTLNLWGGQAFDPLMSFVQEQAGTVDVFCFQEMFDTPTTRITATNEVTQADGVRVNLLSEIKRRLPRYDAYYAPQQAGYIFRRAAGFSVTSGTAFFVKKSLTVEKYPGPDSALQALVDSQPLPDGTLKQPANLQIVQCHAETTPFTIFNLHGLIWPAIAKSDTKERLEQAKIVRTQMKRCNGKRILCGDFNLNPDTDSFKIMSAGLRDLVKEYGITFTRSSFFNPEWSQFADYVLVSKEVEVVNFGVLKPYPEISDHLPLLLECR